MQWAQARSSSKNKVASEASAMGGDNYASSGLVSSETTECDLVLFVDDAAETSSGNSSEGDSQTSFRAFQQSDLSNVVFQKRRKMVLWTVLGLLAASTIFIVATSASWASSLSSSAESPKGISSLEQGDDVLRWVDFTGLLINAGSTQTVRDSRRNQWISDAGGSDVRSLGNIVGSDGCDTIIHGNAIDNTLFCTGRISQPQFSIQNVPDGAYVVTIHFMYPSYARKEFEVFINDLRVYRELVTKSVQAFTSQSIDALVEVKGGYLQIDFWRLQTEPHINAIEVHKANSPFGAATTNLTYIPGLLTMQQSGLILSEGLEVRRIATSKQRVTYGGGGRSDERFHEMPDAGATFIDTRPGNEGGWIYVSNAEVRPVANGTLRPGGVGAMTFNKDGDVVDYRRVLDETRANCGGGRTPWHTWVSCEEIGDGNIYQVDPMGVRPPERITMGDTHVGKFESFAFDYRDPRTPYFFVTKDDERGELRRFTPDDVDGGGDPWKILTGSGTLNYLVLTPSIDDENIGTFVWSPSKSAGAENAAQYFPNTEGIDVFGNELYFISKILKRLVVLDLDYNTYVFRTTQSGLFQGQPDQIHQVSGKDHNTIYFTEDGGQYAGIHGRGYKGRFYTILESHKWADETTGMSFSPDYKHLYVAYQDNGLLFHIKRVDGLSFQVTPLNIKYHNKLFSLSN